MSEEANKTVELECSMCGRDGGVFSGCSICKGNERFNVPLVGHTLSEYRSGRAEQPARYGPDAQVGPKTSDPLWSGTE